MRSAAAKRSARWALAGLAFLAAFPLIAFAQQPEFAGTCRQALEHYVSDYHSAGNSVRWNSDGATVTWIHNGVEYLCKCVAQNQPPVCNPKGSSGTGGSGDLDLSRFSPGEQLALTAVQSLIKGLFSGISKSRPKESGASAEEALLARQQALQAEEEERKAVLEQWNALQKAEEERIRQEREDAQRRGQEMLAQTGGQGLGFRPISGKKLEFNDWAARRPEATPLPSGKYPAPKTALEQANCAAYFSEKARELADQGKNEESEFMSLQAQKAMVGAPLDAPCLAAAATPAAPVADSPEIQVILDQYKSKVQELLVVSRKLAEVRDQKLEEEIAIQQADEKITDLKSKAASVTKPEEKQEIDDLLREAEALRSESEKRLKIAEDNESAYIKDAQQVENEVQGLNSKLQESKVKK